MSSIIKNLWKKSALEMISLLKNKEVSPREALDSILSRIEETNEDINAINRQNFRKVGDKIELEIWRSHKILSVPLELKNYY